MAGRGVDLKNEEEVAEYLENLGIEYRFGCYHEKNPKACHLLGDYMEAIKKDYHKALKLYETNCNDNGLGHSCFKAGGYKLCGRACSKDATAAYDYFAKGCDNGFPKACLNAGLIDSFKEGTKIRGLVSSKDDELVHHRPQDLQKAKDFFAKACDGDETRGCQNLSGMYISGVPGVVEKDMSKAFKYALKACDLGSVESCVNVSIMYKKGEGVGKDLDQAQKFTNIVKDAMGQYDKQRQRVTFQEGVESAE